MYHTFQKNFTYKSCVLFLLVMFFFYSPPSFAEERSNRYVFLGNHNIPPYIYKQNEEITGLVVDIAHALAQKSKLDIEVRTMDWREAQARVLQGEADALLQINKSRQRESLYDFSEPLLESRFSIFRKISHVQFTTIESLFGFTVGVEAKGYPAELLKKYPEIKVKKTPDWKTGFELVNTEQIQAVIADRWVGEYVLATQHIQGLTVVEDPVESSFSYIAVRKGNRLLLDRINEALKKMHEDGSMSQILNKWSQKEVVYLSQEQLRFYKISVMLAVLSGTLIFVFLLWNRRLHKEIEKRKQAEEKLRQNRDWFHSLISNIPGIIYRCKPDKNRTMLYMSEDVEKISGYPGNDFISNTVRTYESIIHREDTEYVNRRVNETVESGKSWEIEYRICREDGEIRWVYEKGASIINKDGTVNVFDGVIFDITDRKQMEFYQNLSAEVLLILNESEDYESLLRRILNKVKQTTGCDAVGIRLQKDDDFPYYLQNGFTANFLLTENSLVARDSEGDICSTPDGSARLECTCGLVISGRTDPSNPLFTAGGSAWTNDSFRLLNLPEADDPRYHPRNTCIHSGYASVALIPIRAKESIVGLLQLSIQPKVLYQIN